MKRYLTLLSSCVLVFILPQIVFAFSFPAQPTNDYSFQYLQDIFGVVDGVLHGSGSQIMGAMFTVFNAGALALGGIIIIYTMLVGTLRTAHEGEALGREWSSMWIPIKSAAGIGLLLPKATGYSAIQIFMMWAIVQGISIADGVWNSALSYLSNGGMIVQEELGPANISSQVGNVLKSEVCMYGIQAILNQAAQDNTNNPNGTQGLPTVPVFINTVVPIPVNTNPGYQQPCSYGSTATRPCVVTFPGKSSGAGFDPMFDNLAGICGKISWSPPQSSKTPASAGGLSSIPVISQGDIANINQAQTVAVQQIILDLSGPAQSVVSSVLQLAPLSDSSVAPPNVSQILNVQLFGNTEEDYQGIVAPLVSSMANGGGSQDLLPKIYADAASKGWLMAGMYYSWLTMANSNFQKATDPNLTADAPDLGSIGSTLQSKLPVGFNVNPKYSQDLAQLLKDQGSTSLSHYISSAQSASYSINNGQGAANQGNDAAAVLLNIGDRGLSGIFSLLLGPIVGPILAIVTDFVSLMSAQYTNINPVVLIALMGNAMVTLVVNIWFLGGIAAAAAAGILGAIPCVTLSASVNSALLWIIPFLWAILGMMFINGCVMMFYIPMIPFILFLFGALGWYVSVIEAMVAAPLIALGITHPEGHAVLGKADNAVLLLVNVVLRPSMMIIGFIGGIILSYVGIWILNQGFLGAFFGNILQNASSSLTPVDLLLTFPVVVIMYTALAIAIINQAFSLINLVPDRVMRWLGVQGDQVNEMAQQALGQAKGAISGAAEGVGSGAQSGIGNMMEKSKDPETAKMNKSGGNKDGGGGSSNIGARGAGGANQIQVASTNTGQQPSPSNAGGGTPPSSGSGGVPSTQASATGGTGVDSDDEGGYDGDDEDES